MSSKPTLAKRTNAPRDNSNDDGRRLPLNINLDESTFIKLLKANADRFGDSKAALRTKSHGIWKTISWRTYYERVKHFSVGIASLGMVKGDVVAIIGNNRATSLIGIIGVQAAGGIPICLHQDSTAAEAADLLASFGARFVIAEDQEQVDKILEIKGELPAIQGIISCDQRGMRRYQYDFLHPFETLESLGSSAEKENADLFEKQISNGSGHDPAILSTTSGTTSTPRGVLISYRNILSMAISLNQVDPKTASDEYVSFLPLSWFGEQMLSLAAALTSGFTVNFPEKPETALADLREIGPHIVFFPPRTWESIALSVQVRIMETTGFKRFMYRTFMPIGESVAALRLSGKPVPLANRILFKLAHICLFRALRDRIGLSHVRSALSGGSALGEDVFKFFQAIGVNLKQVYGLAEASGISCMHSNSDIKSSTVGRPLPGTEVSISQEGEILLKSSGLASGYYNGTTGSAELLKDGWLHTGDAGRLDENGHLVVIDRIQDLIQLADGTSVAPQFVESKLKYSPYIKEAVLIGTGKPFLTALICMEGSVVGKWAGNNKLSFTTYSDLSSKTEVADLIAKEVAKGNQDLPEPSRIKRFALLYKDLDADEDELTRTGKVRRGVVSERYRDLMEALYAGVDQLPIDVTIDLQDGKSARIVSTVHFRNPG